MEEPEGRSHPQTHRSPGHILCCGFLVILGLQIEEFGLSCFKCCKNTRKEVKSIVNSLLTSQLSDEELTSKYEQYFLGKKGTENISSTASDGIFFLRTIFLQRKVF